MRPVTSGTSPLLATKPAFDAVLYPWVEQSLVSDAGSSGLIVLLNDFADNALVDHAVFTTTARLKAAGAA